VNVTFLYVALGILAVGFAIVYLVTLVGERAQPRRPNLIDLSIGLFVNFLDALGIGSFGTTTSLFKLGGMVRDEQIPGTLNIGLALPAILEAFLYIGIVRVDPTTLVVMIVAAVIGGWFGGGVVAHWPAIKIQLGMGIALLVTATFGLLTQLHWFPGGGDLVGFTGTKLLLAVALSAVLGALKTLGIGFYAPCMMVTYLMGMNPRATFPIMMGSVAFVAPVASLQFLRQKRFNLKSALGLTIGGIPGVLLAAFLVRSLPLGPLRWLVMAVVVYTAVTMLRSALRERSPIEPPS
jgi:uncharacterized membrane protein YfcA